MVALAAGGAINDGKFGMAVMMYQDSKGEHVYMKLVITNVRLMITVALSLCNTLRSCSM